MSYVGSVQGLQFQRQAEEDLAEQSTPDTRSGGVDHVGSTPDASTAPVTSADTPVTGTVRAEPRRTEAAVSEGPRRLGAKGQRGGKRAARAAELRVMPTEVIDEDADPDTEGAPEQAHNQTTFAQPAVVQATGRKMAGPAKPRKRHRVLLLTLVLIVLLPMGAAAWYLWTRATDQYASFVSFSVRKEDTGSSLDILGGLSQLTGGGGSSDTDILYQFMQSQELLSRLDAMLQLRALYSRPYNRDPIFALHPDATIEDLVDYWSSVVKIYYDPGTGLMELRVQAFNPDDAKKVAEAIFAESSAMINRLSDKARSDATRYAREELDLGIERLKAAREAITAFRSRTQIVDPSADIQGQMGLLNTLQAQLAEALIELDLLRETTLASDPRIAQSELRIDVIQARITQERSKFGVGGEGRGGEDYATLTAEFERLSVDREFAEEAYKSALSAFDGAQAEAQRQSRYLAAHVEPTVAESSRYPERLTLLALVGIFGFLTWAIGALVFYSIRDRR